jgi:hypothetical protein
VLVGLVLLLAAALGGHPGEGLVMLCVMAALGLGIMLAGRSEQATHLDRQASAWSGVIVLLAVIGGFTYEIAQGHDGSPYGWIAAVGGIAYLVAVVVLRPRT